MAADIRGFVAKFVEANRVGCGPNGVVDVVWGHKTGLEEELVLNPVNWALLGLKMVHDVVHPSGQRFDGAEVGACALLVDALAFDPIFLTGDDNGGRSGLHELCKRGGVGHNVVSVPKGDVF